MSKKTIICLLGCCFLLWHCSSPIPDWTEDALSLLGDIDSDIVVIVPGAGCSGCISVAEDFVIKEAKKDSSSVIILLTRIESSKILKMKLGEEVINAKNVRIDKNNVLDNSRFSANIYPVVMYLSDKKEVRRLTYQSPENPSAFADIHKD